MSKCLAALVLIFGLILIAPLPASAAKSDGVRNAANSEVSSQRYYRRHVYVRRAYRPWRSAYWGPRWGWGGYYRPWRASYAYAPYWGWGGYDRPWRPWGWRASYAYAPGWGVGVYRPWRPWGWRGYYRPWGWGGWGWGPRWGIGFYW